MAVVKLKPLLVVEDNVGLQKQLKWSFEGYDVSVAGDRESAIDLLKRGGFSVITLDLGLPPDPANASEGLAALEDILVMQPHAKIIVVTGNDDRNNALLAISMGAYDFYQKPIDTAVLELIIDRAYNLYQLEEENRKLALVGPNSPLGGIVCSSRTMISTCRLVEKIAPTEVTTLVLGESGTGKELFAKALHQLSARNDKPFVAINCAAIPDNLLESELFGYEKGAFTGAVKQTPGKVETANGGTLFLDEIGDMPMQLQVKMLRFIQERVVERIGGRATIDVDVRIVCATHRDLRAAIEVGDFREDLFYRISEIVLEVPPLRDRDEDKLLLAQTFLDSYSEQNGRSFKGFTEKAKLEIDAFNWPGNVRELENRVKRAVVLSDDKYISEVDLGLMAEVESQSLNLKFAKEKVERNLIIKSLSIYNNNVTHASEALGISRPSFYKLIKKLNISEPK